MPCDRSTAHLPENLNRFDASLYGQESVRRCSRTRSHAPRMHTHVDVNKDVGRHAHDMHIHIHMHMHMHMDMDMDME